jgi:DNA-binding CsgD family transcriptional regulator
MRVLEMNDVAVELLGVEWPRDDVNLSSFSVNPRGARSIAKLIVEGAIDSSQSVRPVRVAGGERVTLRLWMTIVPAAGQRRYALVLAAPESDESSVGVTMPGEMPLASMARLVTVGTVDADWCIALVSADIVELLGGTLDDWRGIAFLGIVHPADAAELLTAAARVSATGSGCGLRLRLRHDGGEWRTMRMLLTPTESGEGFGFAMLAGTAEDGGAERNRAQALELHLWRIAEEIGAAGVLDAITRASGTPTALPSDLSSRQLEIVTRLLRGERVPHIARAMYLSPNTVRNHLSVVFRKAGVHSQEELLAKLRDTPSSSQ